MFYGPECSVTVRSEHETLYQRRAVPDKREHLRTREDSFNGPIQSTGAIRSPSPECRQATGRTRPALASDRPLRRSSLLEDRPERFRVQAREPNGAKLAQRLYSLREPPNER